MIDKTLFRLQQATYFTDRITDLMGQVLSGYGSGEFADTIVEFYKLYIEGQVSREDAEKITLHIFNVADKQLYGLVKLAVRVDHTKPYQWSHYFLQVILDLNNSGIRLSDIVGEKVFSERICNLMDIVEQYF